MNSIGSTKSYIWHEMGINKNEIHIWNEMYMIKHRFLKEQRTSPNPGNVENCFFKGLIFKKYTKNCA